MKIVWKLTGYYEWLTQNEDSANVQQSTSLGDLLTDLQAIATQQKQHQISSLHQSFGLNFLPDHTLTHLFRYNLNHSSSLMNERTLYPLPQEIIDLQTTRFSCQFVSTKLAQNFRIPLTFDDLQIPVKDKGDQIEGTYRITIENQSRLQNIKNQAFQELQRFIQTNPLGFLHYALNTLNSNDLTINSNDLTINLSNDCTAILLITELSVDFQQAIRFLKNISKPKEFTEQARRLINAYRTKYSQPITTGREIPALSIANTSQSTEFVIGKRVSRQIIENLITNAKKFLMICSYRIEDMAIAKMLASKARAIPIWILTEFNSNVQNRVDANMLGQVEVDPEYANSDRQKRECLLMLRDAGLIFRSGNFHIKSYISENSAYLGSCNLTGGSLGRNGEAGIVWNSTTEHQFLMDYFRNLWTNQTDAETIPLASASELRSTSRRKTDMPALTSDRFLNHQDYLQDVTNSLQNFAGEEVQVYTRNFQPLQQQINLLNSSKNRIFYGSYNNAGLRATKIPNLHAKVIVIGSRVAYIGSQDLATSRDPFLNLTYKTSNPQEIAQIKQKLQNLR